MCAFDGPITQALKYDTHNIWVPIGGKPILAIHPPKPQLYTNVQSTEKRHQDTSSILMHKPTHKRAKGS